MGGAGGIKRPITVAMFTDSRFKGSSRDNIDLGTGSSTIPYVTRCYDYLQARPEYPRGASRVHWVGILQTSWAYGANHSDIRTGETALNVVTQFAARAAPIRQTPDHVLLLYGVNDMLTGGRTPSQVIPDLDNIVQQAKALWPTATVSVCSGYPWLNTAIEANSITLMNSILAGGVTHADHVLDQSAFPTTAMMAYQVGMTDYPNPHPAIQDGPDTVSTWAGTRNPQNYGVDWLARNLHAYLQPDAILPLYSGEVYP